MDKDLLEKVQEALREGQLTSNSFLCAEYRSLLSGEYSYTAGLLEEIKIRKPKVWLELEIYTKAIPQQNVHIN
jgi:hypothetical protein